MDCSYLIMILCGVLLTVLVLAVFLYVKGSKKRSIDSPVSIDPVEEEFDAVAQPGEEPGLEGQPDEEPEPEVEIISRPTGAQLTEYTEYLYKAQLPDIAVYRVKENKATPSQPNPIDYEEALLFTVFSRDGLVELILESTIRDRNTLLFTVDENRLDNATRAIVRFFESNRLKKRSQLRQYLKSYLHRYGVLMISSRQHNTLDSWIPRVRKSPEEMVRDYSKNLAK